MLGLAGLSPDLQRQVVGHLARTANPGIVYDPRLRAHVATFPKPFVHKYSKGVLKTVVRTHPQASLARQAAAGLRIGRIRIAGGLAFVLGAAAFAAGLADALSEATGAAPGGGTTGPEGFTDFCDGWGSHNGYLLGGSCTDEVNLADPVSDLEPQWYESGPNWHWQNKDYTHTDEFENHFGTVVGHYILPVGDPYPSGTEPPPMQQGFAFPAEGEPGMPDGNPLPWPEIDPFLHRPLRPKPRYGTYPFHWLPHRVLNPFRSPSEQSTRGYYPPGSLPERQETGQPFATDWGAGWRPVVRWTSHSREWRSGWHRMRPPGRKVREKKIALTPAGSMAYHAIGELTEALDFIDAFWNALPESVREREWSEGGRKGQRFLFPDEKLLLVYEYFSLIDWEQAVWNLWTNWLEDFVIGQLSRRTVRNLRDVSTRTRHPGVSPFVGPAM